jgi:hypothetical protein
MTAFGLVGCETGDRLENKSLQAKRKKADLIVDHRPFAQQFQQNSFYGIHFDGGP